jgi:hypothetical protein
MPKERTGVIKWLLDGDPSIRWQVLRDLEGAAEPVWRAEQDRVAGEGWGARLLQHQDEYGRWTPRLYGKKWISTTYTMVLLRRMGLPRSDPRAIKACQLFLDEAIGADGGINISSGHPRSEACVTSLVLALLYWFDVNDPRRERVLEHLLGRQLADGGWNCDVTSDHGSFHTTDSAMEALRECAVVLAPINDQVQTAEAKGREFMLIHRLFRSHRTGEIVNPQFLRLSFPPRWHHDVLRTLDYFCAARALDDGRLRDAIDVVEKKRDGDGRWPLQQRWPGQTWFEMETVGEPSRWNTLRAMRVLEAWRAAQPDSI